MITFSKFVLDNGLKVIVHEDPSTPMVAFNLLYDVGSKYENPEKTGFAHLFEHLMFGGSENVEDFDSVLQMAGGESNAFTNNDVTNFYDLVPAENLETVFWVESDRMANLKLNQKALDVQRKVVVEEFKETCLNEPYGDAWHLLMEMAYTQHPYQWPTIGKIPRHIEDANLNDVQHFFEDYYRPDNAIMVVAGNVRLEQVKELSEKWFGHIPAGHRPKPKLQTEPQQNTYKKKTKVADVPTPSLFMAFHAPARTEEAYYASDLLTDVLANGRSSRLFRKLKKEKQLFIDIDAYITGSLEPGILVVEGKPAEGVSLEDAEAVIWEELEALKVEKVSEIELEKIKNKAESSLEFSECNILNKAINLAMYELIEDANLINQQSEAYQKVDAAAIQQLAQQTFNRENCSVLYYIPEV